MDINVDRRVQLLLDEVSIVSGGTETTVVVDMRKALSDDFSIQYKFASGSGAGNIKIEALESLNNSDFENNATDVASGLTLAGNASDIVKFTAGKGAAFLKFILTENGTAGAIISLWICVR